MYIEKLIYLYEKHNPGGHFFDKQTLKFFGERLSDMRVLKGEYIITDNTTKETKTCYGISRLQRNYPGGAKRTHVYFDKGTFSPVNINEYETIQWTKGEKQW